MYAIPIKLLVIIYIIHTLYNYKVLYKEHTKTYVKYYVNYIDNIR